MDDLGDSAQRREKFGAKSRVAVAATMTGFAIQNSLMRNSEGTHSMMVSKALRRRGANNDCVVELTTLIDYAAKSSPRVATH